MTILETFEPDVIDKIEELKKRFEKDMKPSMLANNEMFYKFLKARGFDLDRTELMLKNHLAWRKEYRVDDVLTDQKHIPVELQNFCPYSFVGFDKDGSPIYYIDFGNFDIRGFRKTAKFYNRARYLFKLTEEEVVTLKKQSEKLGKTVRSVCYIINMVNFAFTTATDKNVIDDIIRVVRFYQDNYPEHLKTIYVINTSMCFTIAWQVVRKFMAPSLFYKFKIMGNDEDEWKSCFLKAIDAECLPAFLGGTRTDPDGNPMCNSFLRHGQKVHPKYFMNKNSTFMSKNMKKLVIPRSAFSEIELQVQEAESFIEWEFETKSSDVGFGLLLKEEDANSRNKMTELVPVFRLNTDEMLGNGSYKCDKPGTYVILFDNSYSWLRSKELFYTTRVISPKERERSIEDN